MKRVLLILCVVLTQLMMAQVPSYIPTNGLVGYWPFNGNANDASGNGNNGTVNGATLTNDRFGNPNSAYQFNGSGSGNSIVIPNSASLNFTGQMSFSFWLKFSNPQPLATILCRYTGSNPINGYSALLSSPGGNKARFDIGNGILPDYGGSSVDGLGVPLNDGSWHNIFGTFGSYNQNLYVDGIWVDSTFLFQNGIGSIVQNLTIGKDPAYGNARNFTGVIDDVCIWNVVVPDNGITYTNTNLTCAPNYFNTQNLVGYWPFCGNANDESGHGNNGIVSGPTLTSNRLGNPNSAYSFNNNVITLPTNNLFNSNQFSVSAWFNTSDTSITYSTIFSNYNGSTTTGVYSGFWMGLLGNKANVFIGNGANGIDILSNISCNDGLWHLMTATRNGNTFSLYLDGVLQNSQNVTMAVINTTPMIGNSPLNEAFIGKIDDVIFWNRVIDQFEVNSILSYYNCANDLAINPNNNLSNIGSNITITATTSDPSPNYVWQSNFGQGWIDLINFGSYSGINTNQLSINNLQLANHNQPIRAIINSGTCVDTSNTINIALNNPCTSFIYDTITTYLSVTDTLIINQTITGLVAPNNTNTIKIFPNPTSDHVTINYGNYALMNGYTLNITNALGQVVFTSPINLASSYLNLSTWGGSGTYFVHIINAQGATVNTRKIVLQ
jgi:hypothetical protein